MEIIVGIPDARLIETVYVTSVAFENQMYEFATRVRKNTLVTDQPGVISETYLRSGKLKRSDIALIIPHVENAVRKVL